MREAIDGWLTTEVRLFEALLAGVVLAALIWVLWAAVRSDGAVRRAVTAGTGGSLRERLRDWTGVPLKTTAGTIFLIVFGTAYIALVLLGIVSTFVLLGNVLFPDTEAAGMPTTGPASLGLGALLVALLGAPFLVWRNRVAQETLDLGLRRQAQQDDAAFNDKINAAATDLAARRQVTRVVGHGKEKRVLTEWEDDLVTRMAAIDRLEALAIEAITREDFPPAQRIARMLSIYVRELSEVYKAEEMPRGVEGRKAIRDWARGLEPRRRDMERAAQSLGRINPKNGIVREQFGSQNIDLRYCQLQGCDLHGLVFSGARLENANMQGAELRRARFDGANLKDAILQGGDLSSAKMQGAVLTRAQMKAAELPEAQLQETDLTEARLQWAELQEVNLEGANLSFANLDSAILLGANLNASVLVGTQLKSAYLFATSLQGAFLEYTEWSEDTNLNGVSLRGAAIKPVDAATLEKIRKHWEVVFCDATSREFVPDEDCPKHWTRKHLSRLAINIDNPISVTQSPFFAAWHNWAAQHHPDVAVALDPIAEARTLDPSSRGRHMKLFRSREND